VEGESSRKERERCHNQLLGLQKLLNRCDFRVTLGAPSLPTSELVVNPPSEKVFADTLAKQDETQQGL
jgi:hypothetical protein